ncbi:MAG: site-specific integrase [Desulfovibrionaceae bacterium]|nr:site-specific integrase [Desulfovibrionaceae bacterium]
MTSKPQNDFGTFHSKKSSTFFEKDDLTPNFEKKSRPTQSRKRTSKGPTHVYLKKSTYYFRYVFTPPERQQVGYSEIRLSLRTGYKRQAQEYARVLYGNLKEELIANSTLDYSTLKKRLTTLLQKLMGNDLRPHSPSAQHDDAAEHPVSKLLFSKLMEQYISTKLSDGRITEASAVDYRNRLDNFIEIIGDKPVGKIDRQDVRDFRDTLQKLPPHRKKSKKNRRKTIKKLLSMTHAKTMSTRTVNDTTQAVSTLFEWAVREGLITYNPAKGLKIKDKTPDVEKRDAFTQQEIQKIFLDARYVEDTHTHPAYFWCPLIGLYTGMRLEEIAQLHIDDIYEHKTEKGTDIWVIDIREESASGKTTDKKLKNRNAKRIIPIHQDLIDIGLLEFHKRQPKRHTRLFSELNASGGRYGKQAGKQFSDILRRGRIKTPKNSFHSLRHTFRDQFKKLDISNLAFSETFGHASAEASATRGYGSTFTPKEKYDRIISLLSFPLDIEMLSKSRFAHGKK